MDSAICRTEEEAALNTPRRKRRSRRLTLVALVALAAGATLGSGCGDDDDASSSSGGGGGKEPVRIAFFNYASGNTYTAAVQQGMQDAAEKVGGSVQIFDGQAQADKQFAAMQDALSSGKFDAFLVTPINAVGLTPLFRQAKEEGIPVGTVSYPAGDDLTTLEPAAGRGCGGRGAGHRRRPRHLDGRDDGGGL
jgi:ribose transport system substrate-binding protein